MSSKKDNLGCGCAHIPFSVIIILLGLGYWGFKNLDRLHLPRLNLAQRIPEQIDRFFPRTQQQTAPDLTPGTPHPVGVSNDYSEPEISIQTPTVQPTAESPVVPSPLATFPQTPWEKKQIRGIYLSRYQATNNASEQAIRERVRYYRQQGLNTIIHGVWGNGCTMYRSEVMQQTFGYPSCPNQFQDRWLDWLIDEAHKQGMQVHAYFEKGIKIDKNSPMFDWAISQRWIVPGVDRTYPGIEHYVLDVEIPEVGDLFKKISVEFVKKYPTIDAVQWDDYLGYHAELPGKVDRTTHLTNFVRQMRAEIEDANPDVSFDICHHNPYWGKRYFAADWENWNVDRAFIQIYNDSNFDREIEYAVNYNGVAISDRQFHRFQELLDNTDIESILVFPADGKPEETAASVKKLLSDR